VKFRFQNSEKISYRENVFNLALLALAPYSSCPCAWKKHDHGERPFLKFQNRNKKNFKIEKG
jgi:hypothetical protein